MKALLTPVRIAALAGIVLISFSAIFFRLAGRTPITAAFFRMAYAVPVLFVLARLLGGRTPRASRFTWLAFAAGGALSFDLYLWHQAIEKIGAGLATIVANIQVPLVGLGAWFLHRERPHVRAFFAIPVVFAGVALISGLALPGAYGVDPVGGSLLGAAAGIAYSAFLLAFRASGRGGAHPVVPLFEATLAAATCCLLIGLVDGGLDLRPSWPSHGWLLALSLGCSVVGWSLISYSITRLAALETSVLLMLQPVLTMVWAIPIFGEWVSAVQWTGVALVLGGVGYLSLRGSMKESPDAGAGPGVGPAPGASPTRVHMPAAPPAHGETPAAASAHERPPAADLETA